MGGINGIRLVRERLTGPFRHRTIEHMSVTVIASDAYVVEQALAIT